MKQVLVLSNPTQNEQHPMLDLTTELIRNGEKVTFFGDTTLQTPVKNIGADFKTYTQEVDIFNNIPEEGEKPKSGLISALLEPMKFIDDIIVQIRGLTFDYVILSPSYPYANIITKLLGISGTQQIIPSV